MERMQLQHHPVVAGNDDIRAALAERAPKAGQRGYSPVIVGMLDTGYVGHGMSNRTNGVDVAAVSMQRNRQSGRQRPPFSRSQ